ncbi:MAG: alpha/beta hydrolase [Bacillota bacterium]
MNIESYHISTPDRKSLAVDWYHVKKPKGIVHILHGMGEHSKRYESFAKYLAANGFTVVTHDHRNHGRSVKNSKEIGIFEKNETFETMVNDVMTVQSHIRSQLKAPMVILGHSMGSIILRRYLQRAVQIPDAAILMGTLQRYNKVNGSGAYVTARLSGLFKKNDTRNEFIYKMLNKSMKKSLKKSEPSTAWIAHDDTVVKDYNKDPKSGFVYNKQFYNTFFKALIEVNKAENIKKTPNIPLLFISGTDDPLSNNMKAIKELKSLHESLIEGLDATLMAIPNARHEVLNEGNRQETFDKILKWITDTLNTN